MEQICTLASGSNTINARATDTSGNIAETSVTVSYQLPPTFDFSISVSPNSGSVNAGKTLTNAGTVSLTLISGSTQPVTLSLSGLPSNVGTHDLEGLPSDTCSPPCSISFGIGTYSGAPFGTYTLTIKGTGGGKTHSTIYALQVKSPTPTITPICEETSAIRTEMTRYQHFSIIKGSILNVRTSNTCFYEPNLLRATFDVTNIQNAMYAIDIYVGQPYTYSKTVFVEENGNLNFMQGLPRYVSGKGGKFYMKMDVQVAVGVYLISYMFDETLGFTPSEPMLWLVTQEVKQTYFPNKQYLQIEPLEWVDAFGRYINEHPERFVQIATVSGLNYGANYFLEKANVILSTSVAIVDSAQLTYKSLTRPAEETIEIMLTDSGQPSPTLTSLPIITSTYPTTPAPTVLEGLEVNPALVSRAIPDDKFGGDWISVTVKNNGDATVKDIRASSSGDISNWIASLDTSKFSLDPGLSVAPGFYVKPPNGQKPGNYAGKIVYSGKNAKTGKTESSSVSLSIIVPSRNDWSVEKARVCTGWFIFGWSIFESCDSVKQVKVGDNFKLKIDIINRGNTPISGIKGNLNVPAGFSMSPSNTQILSDINKYGDISTMEWYLKATETTGNYVEHTISVSSNP